MKILSWHDWLDKHIPYYEANGKKKELNTNPTSVGFSLTDINKDTIIYYVIEI